MDPQLKSQLKQWVRIANATSISTDGELQYTASSSHLSRVVGKNHLMRNSAGELATVAYTVILSSTVSIRVNSKVYLPGESSSGNDGWVPIALKPAVDETGATDFYKVYL